MTMNLLGIPSFIPYYEICLTKPIVIVKYLHDRAAVLLLLLFFVDIKLHLKSTETCSIILAIFRSEVSKKSGGNLEISIIQTWTSCCLMVNTSKEVIDYIQWQ